MGHHADAPSAGFRFEHVSCVVDATTILDDVSVVLAHEGVTAVAGPSGAGKSTLLRLCNRLEVATSGRILLDGDDIADLDPLTLRRRVGMVFQRPVVFAGTVRENLLIAHPRADDAALAAAMGRAGLEASFLDRRADDLSGGEAQRSCVARALLTDPEVLLMDEPTSALDVDARQTIEHLARDLADQGIPVVWVTHDLDQAERLTDHTIVMMAGRIVDDEAAASYLAARSFEEPDT